MMVVVGRGGRREGGGLNGDLIVLHVQLPHTPGQLLGHYCS